MHRLIVVILAAVDAAIAAAVGIAATLAPLTIVWVLGLGGTAEWSALWPTSAAVWQLGNLVPLQVSLPGDYLAVAGIDPAASTFVLSLAPLAFASFTAIFAARSGARASKADSWLTGVITASVVFAALTTMIALTSSNSVTAVERWQAILIPSLMFMVPLLAGALVTEWREASKGLVSRVRDRIEGAPRGWGEAPGLVVRGTAVVLAGLIGMGALLFAVSLMLRGGEVIALYEAAHLDVLGATVVTLAQLAYLPTLVIWGMAFIAGPGIAVGAGTAVSPPGTQLGVIPGIPVLGVLPESTTPWLLLLGLLPVALGAFAGVVARMRLPWADIGAVAEPSDGGVDDVAVRDLAATDLIEDAGAQGGPGGILRTGSHEPIGARAVIAVGIAVLSAAGAAVLAVLASGSIGPGRLTEVGPAPGAVALAVGVEVVLGAAIVLLSPRRRPKVAPPDASTDAVTSDTDDLPLPALPAPISAAPDGVPAVDLGPRRPRPLPPVD